MKVPTKEVQEKTTPQMALQMLREGNYRFVNNLKTNRNLLQQVLQTSEGQYPLVTILSCIDSRTSAELIFDQGLGKIFSIRIAGNVVNEDILGSMEFACKLAGSKLIVVLGHTKCGAIKGACDNAQMGNLTKLLEKIQPAVAAETTTTQNRDSKNTEFVEKVTRLQVAQSTEAILSQSEVLRSLIEEGQLGLIAGVYDVDTGAVEFLEETFMQGEIKPLSPEAVLPKNSKTADAKSILSFA